MDILVALVFLISAFGKIINPIDTDHVLRILWGMPQNFVPFVRWELILSELIVAALLLTPAAKTRRAGTVVACIALGLFSLSLARQWWSTIPLKCGCGLPGLTGDPHLDQLIAIGRNLSLLVALLVSCHSAHKLAQHQITPQPNGGSLAQPSSLT